MIASGLFSECERAVCIPTETQGVEREWQRAPATERQVAALRKFGLKREGITRGEASMLLEIKSFLLAIKGVK